jgi:hypothetical protein
MSGFRLNLNRIVANSSLVDVNAGDHFANLNGGLALSAGHSKSRHGLAAKADKETDSTCLPLLRVVTESSSQK